jgi:hypothetical protein
MIVNTVCKLLIDIHRYKSDSFVGLGVIVYNEFDTLPISPLKLPDQLANMPIKEYKEILELLLKVATIDNFYHDGFHLISNNFQLTHLSQYFSTPIVKGADADYLHGSRERTALYGSFLPQVITCGVVSQTQSPIIFMKGIKIDPYSEI